MGLSMQGIKVLDFSMGIAGPQAGMLCALQGADVVKVEGLEGDWSRGLGQRYGDMTAYAAVSNRGKRSLAVDLKDAAACEAVRDLAASADVVIEAFRPGVMQRLGLDYAAVAHRNPKVVYLSINGFGVHGPLADAPATDVVLQAFSGFMYCNKNSEGAPQRLDLFIIDLVTGLYAYQAIANSLLEIARTGVGGRHVECSLLSAALALQAGKLVEQHMEPSDQSYYVPLGVYRTRDGSVSLSVRSDNHFALMCAGLGREDLVACGLYTKNVQRISRKAELDTLLRAEFAQKGTEEISALLTRIDILHSRVNTHAEMLRHPQIEASAAVDWMRQSGIDGPLPIPRIPGTPSTSAQAPHLGQHSSEVLIDWGTHPAVVVDLIERQVIRDIAEH